MPGRVDREGRTAGRGVRDGPQGAQSVKAGVHLCQSASGFKLMPRCKQPLVTSLTDALSKGSRYWQLGGLKSIMN